VSGAATPTAAVVVIGNEVLSGRTQDQNLKYLGERLGALGIPVVEARIIADRLEAIGDAVDHCRRRYTYVFTTGGIGPTHDDITAEAIARAFGVPLRRDPRALALLRRHYRSEDLNAARLKMADIPEGADLVTNPVSTAPGFRIGNVFVLAGVPSIMRAMFDGLAPDLAGGPPVVARTIAAFTVEGAIAEPLAAIQAAHPAVEIGSYPFIRDRRFGVSLVVRGIDGGLVEAAAAAIAAMLRAAGVEPIEEG
jgi:molybdenum cofactor synthesis domain-containing protein